MDKQKETLAQLPKEGTHVQSKIQKTKENVQPEVAEQPSSLKRDSTSTKSAVMCEKDINMNVVNDSSTHVSTLKPKDSDLKALLEVSKLPRRDVPIVSKSSKDNFSVQYSKTSRSDCQKCKEIILKDTLRIGREMIINSSSNFYTGSSGGLGIGWWHLDCFFQDHTSKLKWSSFEGVEELSVDDQKALHKRACHRDMPDDLVAQVTAAHEAVDAQNKLRQLKLDRKMEVIQKREEKASRLAGIKNTSVDDVIRDNISKLIEDKTTKDLKNIVKENDLNVPRPKPQKGKKKSAPNREECVEAIVKANPLSQIGKIVHEAVSRQIKIDELKVLLDKAGLSKVGSKVELADRLLSHLGIELSEETKNEMESNVISNGFEHCVTKSSVVLEEKEEEDPDMVISARRGDLESVKMLLENSTLPIATLNMSCKWTEVEERKGGLKKSWTLHGETPLLASSRKGHVEIVHFLLTQEADPTLEGCIAGELNDSPLSAVEKNISILNKQINRLDSAMLGSDALSVMERLAKFECIKQLLSCATQYWSRATYAGAHYTDRRKNAFQKNANKPTNSTEMQSRLSSISTVIVLDEKRVQDLDLRIQKAKADEMERKEAENQVKADAKERKVQKKKTEKKEGGESTVVKVNPKELSGNGLQYEGRIVNWMKGFGFLKVSSPRLTSDIYVHISDIGEEEERKMCRSGSRMKFEIVESDRKPGTFQAKNVVMIKRTPEQ